MCFSPEADAVVGGIVVAIGVDTLRHVREPKQVALASLPLLFGLHQLDEAFVWWGLQGHVSHEVGRVALWVYLVFAFVALPALVPAGVWAVEGSLGRRRAIAAFATVGAAVGIMLGAALLRGSVGAEIAGRHIDYSVTALPAGGALTAVYVVATCGALLAAGSRDLAALGALNLLAVPVLVWMTVNGFVSLWCFWAAIVSVVIDFHVRRRAGRPRVPARN